MSAHPVQQDGTARASQPKQAKQPEQATPRYNNAGAHRGNATEPAAGGAHSNTDGNSATRVLNASMLVRMVARFCFTILVDWKKQLEENMTHETQSSVVMLGRGGRVALVGTVITHSDMYDRNGQKAPVVRHAEMRTTRPLWYPTANM